MGKLLFYGGINKNIFYVLIGFMTGTCFVVFSGSQSSCEKIITVHRSKYDNVDLTCQALQSSLKSNGFNCKGFIDLNNSMAAHGFQLSRPARVVQFGKTKYAHDLVMTNPEVSVLMPCAFGVYEDDGAVYISSLDRGLIGRMFGGTAEKIMGEDVVQDLSKVLNDCIKHKDVDVQTERSDACWFNE